MDNPFGAKLRLVKVIFSNSDESLSVVCQRLGALLERTSHLVEESEGDFYHGEWMIMNGAA